MELVNSFLKKVPKSEILPIGKNSDGKKPKNQFIPLYKGEVIHKKTGLSTGRVQKAAALA